MPSEPKTRDYSEISHFEDLEPSPEGIPREATSVFPGAVDAWPDHADAEDEKVFAQYNHNVYTAIIAVQKFLKDNLLDAGVLHAHTQYVTTYQGDPTIDLEFPAGITFIPGSVWATLRGRMLEKGASAEWQEGTDNRTIVLGGSHPNADEIGDTIIVGFALPLQV